MVSELSAIFFGLSAAACWGAGDFSGGLATKRNNVFIVVIFSQLIGIVLLIGLAILFSEPFPALVDMIWGGIAGLSGAIGLSALYLGLSRGQMGVVAPVAGLITALVPIIFGALLEGLPATHKLLGFLIALIAVWLISREDGEETGIQIQDLGLPVLAGLGFGFFQVIIDQTSEGAVLWPLVAVRIVSLSTLITLVVLTRQIQIPKSDKLPLIAITGIFDSGGNAFFVLAAQTGRLDIAAILSSFSPAGVVLLACFFLKEKIAERQWLGIITALIAVILITA